MYLCIFLKQAHFTTRAQIMMWEMSNFFIWGVISFLDLLSVCTMFDWPLDLLRRDDGDIVYGKTQHGAPEEIWVVPSFEDDVTSALAGTILLFCLASIAAGLFLYGSGVPLRRSYMTFVIALHHSCCEVMCMGARARIRC